MTGDSLQFPLLGGWMALVGAVIMLVNRYSKAHPDFAETYLRFRHEQTPEGRRLADVSVFFAGLVFVLGGLALAVLAALGVAK